MVSAPVQSYRWSKAAERGRIRLFQVKLPQRLRSGGQFHTHVHMTMLNGLNIHMHTHTCTQALYIFIYIYTYIIYTHTVCAHTHVLITKGGNVNLGWVHRSSGGERKGGCKADAGLMYEVLKTNTIILKKQN